MAFRAPRAVDDRELGPSQAALDEIVDYTRAAPSGRPRVCKGPQAARWKSLRTKSLIAMSSSREPQTVAAANGLRPTRLLVQSLPRIISQGPSPSLASNAAGITSTPLPPMPGRRYAGKHAREAGRWRRAACHAQERRQSTFCAVAGGAYRLLAARRDRGQFDVPYIDQNDDAALSAALDSSSSLVLIETPSNPLLRIFDIRAIAARAKAAGAKVAVDNTFLSPALQRPIVLGADFVIHSTTKFLNATPM